VPVRHVRRPRPHRSSARRLLTGAVAVLALALSATPAAAHGHAKVTVMTRNVYLGGDITRPLSAVQGITDPAAALVAFANANDTLRTIVDRTDFPSRSELLAREIAQNKPDLVGLQEVALWRSGPLQLDQVGTANARTVDYDFLTILLAALADRHQRYEAVHVQQESDVEGPAFAGVPGTATFANPRDVRLTMRDVILRRVGSDVQVESTSGANYAARLDVPLGGATFSFIRGYDVADVRVGHQRLRFVNTHLESQFSGLALAQAAELLQGPAAVRDRAVVVVCDCNSDPLDPSTKPGDPTPHFAPYRLITGPGGFTDEWLRFAPAQAGFTSGLSELVNDPDTTGIDHRIDMVFARQADGSAMRADHGRVTGLDRRTESGLWASDHAGVVLRLRP
jgi:endonuclease/exonuclease/phosphatase family metal-dependent hydrolase